MGLFAQNLKNILAKARAAEIEFARPPGSVALLAVSKGRSIVEVQEAVDAGQRSFGESYVQEALPKINALLPAGLEWHFIGPIQQNKTRKIAESFDWVLSVDRAQIAKRLNEQRPLRLPPLNICIQVNISAEPTKSGIFPNELEAMARYCLALQHLRLRGLMAVPAPRADFQEQRAQCGELKKWFDHLNKNGFNLDTLSMGMSADFEAAIAEGATLIRIGSALFESAN